MSPLPTPEFRPPPDLTDPSAVIAECESMANGMEQQAAASKHTSGMGGHPYPEFFFLRVAEVLKAAASIIKSQEKQPSVPPEPETPQPKPEPARSGKK